MINTEPSSRGRAALYMVLLSVLMTAAAEFAGAAPADRPNDAQIASPTSSSDHDTQSGQTKGRPAVSLVYLVPSDRQPIPGFERVLQNTLVHLQRWYADQMDGHYSFAIADPSVRTVRTDHPSTWYASTPNGPAFKNWFFNNVAAEGFKQTGGGYGSRQVISLIYIDAEMAEGQFGGAGTEGAAVLHRLDIEGLTGKNSEPVCRWVGGLGHELGHAFGRPHPPQCEGPDADGKAPECETIMFRGMYHYPKTTIADADRQAFDQSPFFTTIAFSNRPFDCASTNKIALQTPGRPACESTTTGARPPDHVCYASRDGLSGVFERIAGRRWHEANPKISVDWAALSESAQRVLLFDRSRNLTFEIDLERNAMRWRVGEQGSWTDSHKVTGHD